MDPAIRVTRRRIKAAVLVGVVVLGRPECTGVTGPARALRGSWGGEHIVIEVQDSVALVLFDCAHGRMTTPIAMDEEGDFSAPGSYTQEHGGPIRDNEVEQRIPARYTGRITGDHMTVTTILTGQNRRLGSYVLTRGGTGRVFRCL